MTPIRTLFILPSLRRAGAQTQTVDLLNTMSGKFCNSLVSFESNLDLLPRLDQGKVKFTHIPRTKKLDMRLVQSIAGLIDEKNIQLVHCTLQFAYLMGWLARRSSVRKPPIIASIHTTLNVSFKDEMLDRFLYRKILKDSKKIIFVCETQADYWRNKFLDLSEKATVVYNGVDPNHFKPGRRTDEREDLRLKYNIGKNSFVVSCIAGFRKEKGHDFLLQAFSGMEDGAHLLLAGEGELKPTMEDLARQLGLSENVHFLGNVADVRPVLEASNISVLSSTAVETFSIAMLESMSMQVPVVATDIGGLKEAIFPGKTGELVPPRDPVSLREALVRRMKDPQGTKKMGQNAREEVLRKFSIQKMTENTEQVLLDIFQSVAARE